jgi:pimeloyl-ACP methyl ester carboxylesterase
VTTEPSLTDVLPRLVSVGGSRAVEVLSVGAGEAVVLSSPSWWPLDAWLLAGVPELVDRFRVVAFNHRGVGRSEPGPGPYDVAGLAADLLQLMDALDIQQAHLVGFAIGSVIAMHAASQAPERVRSLVIGAAGAGGAAPRDAGTPPGLVEEMRRGGYEAFLREHALNEQAFGARTRADNPGRIEALADLLGRRAAREEEFVKHAQARGGHSTLDLASRVSRPALVLVGAEDFAARGASTPAALAPRLAERLPDARLEMIEGVRHMLFWDQSEVVWARVRAFLDQP